MRKPLPVFTDLIEPGDNFAMRDTIRWCQENDVPITRPSPYQIKVGPVNYYPSRQTITIDNERTTQKGFAAFQVLASEYALTPSIDVGD